MSIKYKVVEKGMPGVVGGGEKKFYAANVTNGEMSLEELTKAIEKISTVSGADIRAVVYALVDVMSTSLSNGSIVRLGELGSLRVSIKSEGVTAAEDVRISCIKGAKVLFTPGKDLKSMLKNLEYQKS